MKGLAIQLMLEKSCYFDGQYPDFIACVGSTSKDEQMFKKLLQMSESNKKLEVMKYF